MAEQGRAAFNPEARLPEVAWLGTGRPTSSYIERHLGYKAVRECGRLTAETIFKSFTQTYHVKWALVILIINIDVVVLTLVYDI